MTIDNLEKIGKLKDRIDNLVQALTMPLPPQMHIDCLKNALPEIATELKEVYVEEGGEDWWI